MAYIGREPQIGNYQVCDAISVVNAQAAYTMQVSSVNVIPESVNHMIVSLNGVIQKPGSSYTISSSTITFSSNLATGDSIDFIYLLGNVLDLGTPSDDTVTGAKIVDNAINSEHYTDASIDLAHLSADSVDGSKIVDNAINSEHYTDGSIDTAHIGADQITNAKIADDQIDSEHYVDGSIDLAHLAADSVNATKIADDAISEEHLDVTAVTGHTAETSIADGDLILIHDASASALRKMTKANFVSGIGGANTPAFMAQHAGNTTTANDNTETAVPFAVEKVDTDSAFASNAFTVPSGEGGNYFISAQVIVGCPSSGVFLKTATVNVFVGSTIKLSANVRIGDLATALNPSCNGILPLAEGDVVSVKATGDTNDSSTVRFEGDSAGGTSSTYFSGFKLI